jgi:hypothetical protein
MHSSRCVYSKKLLPGRNPPHRVEGLREMARLGPSPRTIANIQVILKTL